ncbi:hypothetical protein EHW67_13850 [Arenibacter aquaticus]|uniref:Uncharacterized protein n=1 Tax=Arenibacter aquaticus TaxID=2489054 RepID=A0A3S0AD37_9FLAO|nr:hypothetical protein [Arenibacter aquaticus]RTE52753.1 hypothetical protein EHW67_13850 [Arenibacter aquaticus]
MLGIRSQIKVSLGYFLLAALLGVLLRMFVVVPIPVNYRFIVHTHSHIALLGWVYVALTTLLYYLYLHGAGLKSRYGKIFWFTQLCLLGMLLSFPFQGYALFSIIFSSMFLVASYWFTAFFIKNVPQRTKDSLAYRCIRIALLFMVSSSIGPWALGGIMTVLGPESIWYRLAIYFYLHFQYNGWMVMALAGLLFYLLQEVGIVVSDKRSRFFFRCTGLGIVLSFFLSTLWTAPGPVFYIMGGLGALLQLLGFGLLFRVCFKNRQLLKSRLSPTQYSSLKLVSVLLIVKMLLQLLTALPYFASLSTTILDFTIGYLHWTFLGVVSLGLFFFLDYYKMIKLSKTGLRVYFTGFVITELLIFYRGTAAWLGWGLIEGYSDVLAVGSLLIPISLMVILWTSKGQETKSSC